MPRHLSSVLMILSLSVGTFGPTLAVASDHADLAPVLEHHPDGTPCPDGDGSGPCEDGCPCLCCPCHSTPVAPLHEGQPIAFLPSSCSGPIWAREDAAPDGVAERVFRPPRV